ncbi:efflux RND transporter permease subunit [Paenibacillus oenotherae]|uniref:Efflux RND transporter permease subunit n=1 Tax=Paenibacillus oenotherae TaxID=1435645 RepID=A0ABS7D455_9BACL|nr:efflux RND transporter permease subunit [Paenibacillus oenotherae]MBW7474707.1 efflux RND transporter permease subunit [Paenibacillus oenotherae]
MKALISFSMSKIAAMLIIIAILFGGGLYSGSSLKIENMPDVSFPIVMITTSYQASPQDVMNLVTKPIEDKIANIADLDTISSTSSDNMSAIIVQFKQDGVDIDKKKQDLESLVQEVYLPSKADRPKVSTLGYASIPAYYLSVNAEEGMTQSELDRIYEEELKPRFESIKGIDHIDSIGSRTSSLDIQLDANALIAYDMTLPYIAEAIQAALQNGSIGTVKLDGNTQIVRVKGDLDSVYNLENMEITAPAGQLLQLKDVSSIKMISDSPFVARLDNMPAIGVHLYKSSAANAVEFSNETNDLINEWTQKYPSLRINKIFDSADEVNESISGLLREGFIGIALASLMILLFLRNMRMTLIVLVSIPLSILITLMMMHAMNITLNVMSLGGMFIAVGRIVDDSIVVIESIYTNLQKAQKRNESVILLATKQVAMAISSSTFVTAGVFLPIAFVSGIIGGFFRPFALTVACALMTSLLVALTVIPMLAKLMVLREGKSVQTHEHNDGKMVTLYERILIWCLTNRIKTLLVSGLLLIVTIVATVPNLAITFLPDGQVTRQMNYSVKLPYETPFDSTNQLAKTIETKMAAAKGEDGKPLFNFVEALVGYDWSEERVPYAIEIITEVQENADPAAINDQYQAIIAADLPSGSKVIPGSLAGGSGYTATDFSYVLYGTEQQQLQQAAAMVESKLKEFPEMKSIKTSLGDAKTELQIAVDGPTARMHGLSTEQIQATVGGWIARHDLGDLRFDNVVYKTKIELAPRDKDTIELIGQLPIKTPSGGTVYLNEVAKLKKVLTPLALERESQKQMVKVTASIDSPDKAAVSARISEALDGLELPAGVTTELQGVTEDINEGFGQLFAAMAVAVAIVYLIMVLAFGNAGTPFAILFSLPLAVIGGLLGLFVANESINITSLIGFMMLIGIVVTNAIVLLDCAQQLRREGYTARNALIEAGKIRLRPIIMTAGATIAAMIPLALGFSHGTLISKGLAVVVIGGLITSTLLTLVVVPVVYEWIEAFKERMGRMFKRDKAKPTAATLKL